MDTKHSKSKIIPIKNKKNGVTYLYNDQYYWDSEKQQTRHKRVCIGKIDNKTGRQVFNQKFLTLKARKNPLQGEFPVEINKIGQVILLEKIAKDLKLPKILKTVFKDSLDQKILALSFFCTCEKTPLNQAGPWLKSHGFVSNPCKPTDIQGVLRSITRESILMFFEKWEKAVAKDKEKYIYDITSVASYARHNHFLYYGNNRDKEALEQINVALTSDKQTSIPLRYVYMPGNLMNPDNAYAALCHFPAQRKRDCSFVLNRIFYSQDSIGYLLENEYSFMIGVPSRSKWTLPFLENFRKTLEKQEPVDNFSEKTLQHYATPISYGNSTIHLFFDEQWRKEQEGNLTYLLENCLRELEENRPVEEHMQLYDTYFEVRKNPSGSRRILRKPHSLQLFSQSNTGFRVVQTNCEQDPEKILKVYRNRNAIERQFDNLKNEEDCTYLQIHEPDTFESRLFIQFIALILSSSLQDSLEKDASLSFLQSYGQALKEMESFNRISVSMPPENIYTTPTETQLLLAESFGCVLPRNKP
jgi:transposase